MKRQILAILLSLTLAATFMACGGSKEGAETAVAADESISDISMSPTVAAAATDSKTTAGDSATSSQATTPAAADTSTAAQSGQTDVITPIPAQEVTDGTTAGGTTGEGTAAQGTTAAETPADGTQNAPTSQTMITTADINVREEADFEGDILGGYDEGDEITVIGAEGEWYIVEYNGETGYVYSKYLKAKDASGSSAESSDSEKSDSGNSEYGRLVDGDGDPVDLRYYDGSYEIYDEDGNRVYIDGVND